MCVFSRGGIRGVCWLLVHACPYVCVCLCLHLDVCLVLAVDVCWRRQDAND